ncbi:tail protein X [Kushneria pakistanensis]|uniref:Tail protein X n=1 Tax=Kushneria pakistanensis TaxID=1508770 RepID=A0ABQ3FR69_9GAMM|nr:tail protein X [Kushneria pakistanensis]GHC34733.1 tail protein X [Kushneria pakistanensis]
MKYRTKPGDMLDAICHQYYGGKKKNATELVLEANPGLARQGAVIPEHTIIELPDLPEPEDNAKVSLWD